VGRGTGSLRRGLEIDTGGTCGESGVAGGRAAEPLGQGEKNRGIGDPGSEKGDGEICPPRRIANLGRQTIGDIFLRPLFRLLRQGGFSSGFAGGTPISTRTAIPLGEISFVGVEWRG
jgi:hypothetical protein